MADNVKGVLREMHVKTKDDFGVENWNSVYKLGTDTDYVKLPGSGKSLSDILGYDKLDETEIIEKFGKGENQRTIQDLIELKDSILDFDGNYTTGTRKNSKTNSKSLWVEQSGTTDGGDGKHLDRFKSLMPALTSYNQAFYSGDFTYYALGSISGYGAWISMCNLDKEVNTKYIHQNDIREKKDGKYKDEREEYCIEKKLDDILSKNYFTMEGSKKVFKNDEEVLKDYRITLYRGCRIDSVLSQDKDGLGMDDSIKIMDTGPAADYISDSSIVIMPVMFVVPPHTMIYTRNSNRPAAKYAINFYPCANLEQKAESMLKVLLKQNEITGEDESFISYINEEQMNDPKKKKDFEEQGE